MNLELNKKTPKTIICPICHNKIFFCDNIICNDCSLHNDFKECGFDKCKCFKNAVILELYSQVIQLKIENSTLTEEKLYLSDLMYDELRKK